MFHLSKPQSTPMKETSVAKILERGESLEKWLQGTAVLTKIQKDLRGSVISRRLHYLFISGTIKTSSLTCFPARHSRKFRCIRSGWTRFGWTSREIAQRRKCRAFIYLFIYHVFFNVWQINEKSKIIKSHLQSWKVCRILSISLY